MVSTTGKRSASDFAAAVNGAGVRGTSPRTSSSCSLTPHLRPRMTSAPTGSQTCIRSPESAAEASVLPKCKQDQIRVSTPPVTISLWCKSVSCGAADPRPSFSPTSRSTRWLSVYPRSPMLRARRGGRESPVIKCESGNFRLGMPISHRGLTRLYVGIEYICLTSLVLHYLASMFNIVHQQMRDYVLALPDLLS